MQEFLCPQCGASVRFASAGAVMVVCGTCRSTITKDAGVARTVGRMAAVVEDGSPVQIGTRGHQGTQRFNVIGRLRMQYEAGGWNEWYVLFDDGTNGWLSDASDQYALTRRLDAPVLPAPLPAFEDLHVGQPVKIDGVLYLVSDKRESRCVGGEGELPVNAADGWDARAADCRRGRAFATLDYTDGAPVIYAGNASERTDLTPTTLRSPESILASAGRYRGQVLPLDCPNCGAAITIVAAMATQVVCPSCSSVVDCTGDRAEVIEANHRLARIHTTLALGARGQLGVEYTIIGIMRCEVPDDDEEPEWTEYLLFNPERGYHWLVETDDGWQRVTVSDEWPSEVGIASCKFRGMTWPQKYTYNARVKAVFGAFNWRVRRGDETRITDFQNLGQTLTREQTSEEITWSLATTTSAPTISKAFGVPIAPKPRKVAASSDDSVDDATSPLSIAIFASMFLCIFGHDLGPRDAAGTRPDLGAARGWLVREHDLRTQE